MPTLLVNKQLYRETMAAINRLPTKHSYNLDVMILNDEVLWPTWLSVPAVTNEVEKVRVTFRSFGTENAIKGRPRGFIRGCGGPEEITWAFYDLLTRFILGIPGGWRTYLVDKFLKHDVSIKLLELDICSPDVPANLIAPPVQYDELQRLRAGDGVEYLMSPSFLAKFLELHLRALLESYTANYGRLLNERIGTIKVRLDGELRKEWNIGNLLATLRRNRLVGTFAYPKPLPRDHRKLFKNWRRNVYNSRNKLGLPTMPFELKD
jgi:hypothetical protein